MIEPETPDVPEEEFVPEDDAIIGRAFRGSLVVIAGIAAVVVAVILLRREGEKVETVVEKDPGAIEDLARDTEVLPEVRLTDCTREAGIDFRHTCGATGEKLLPETMGGGVAFLDLEGDGDQDLLLVNSTHWAHSKVPGPHPTPALYQNDGSGRFTDVTEQWGLTDSLFGMGVAVGDYDGDGRVDLFLTAVGQNRLYRNAGGRFEDVTAAAGVAGDPGEWGASAGFFDADNDGDLELFVCNYVHWSREIDAQLDYKLDGTHRAYGPPTNYTGTFPYLYRNEGDGTFSDVSEEAGIRVVNPATGDPMAKSLGVTFADLDRDGLIEIIVANDTVQNFLFHNRGGFRFQEIGMESGLGFGSAGQATGAMGVDAGHFRNDSSFGISMGNFANEMSSLYVSQSDALLFSDDSMSEGIGSPSRLRLSFGLFFFDYDLDGRLDLLQSNGHLEDRINDVQASQTYRQPAQLFWNSGPEQLSCYTEVPAESAGDLSRPIVGRGSAYADVDGDGDLDVILTQVGDAPLLLRNDQDLGRHWLRVRLVGTRSNKSAIGAWVVLRAGGVEQRRQVMPTRSYLSQVELPVTFGLGDSAALESLEVVWPDGRRQQVPVPDAVDCEITVEEAGA